VLEDILLAALGGARTASTIVEEELKKLREKSGMKPEEIEAIAKDVRSRLEKRAEMARATAGPAIEAAGEALGPRLELAAAAIRKALDVPSKSELEALVSRLEKAADRLDAAKKNEPGKTS
jgi:hypothetical protein